VTDAATPAERAGAASWVDRLLGAIPLASVVVWLALVQMVEAVGRKTPTIFTDELEWTQISRAIADHGHPARRGAPIFFKSLYVYLLAPVWWIRDTATAYDAALYLNATVMSLAAIPAYLLARRYVSKGASLAVAAATISIPSMAYGGYLIPEVPAYPWSVLCAYLVVQSLSGRGARWTAAAVAACLIAPFVRFQLGVLPVAYAAAAFGLWYAGDRARRLRAGWTRADTIGAWLLVSIAFVVVNRAILHHSYEWWLTTEIYRGRILQHALWATGALATGIGVLPLTAGLAALFPRREERRTRADRALVAFLASGLVGYVFYTGLKGAFLSTQFATRVVERNLIYAAPLLFVGTAVLLERRRLRLVPLAAAVAATIFVLSYMAIQLDYPYYEALGFSMLTLGNRELYIAQSTLQLWAMGIGGIAALILLAVWLGDRLGVRPPARRAALGVVALVVVAWNLTGQIYIARGANDFSKRFLASFIQPPNWVDKQTDGEAVTYLGQNAAVDPNGIHLLEFWNRSIENVWTLDGTAPGPGPTLSPDLARADGTLRPKPPTPYALTDNGVQLVGEPVARYGDLSLYRLGASWRLRSFSEGVDSDGWMSAQSSYTRFAGPPGGRLVVTLSRSNFCPSKENEPPAGRATVVFGRVAVNDNHQPVVAPTGSRTFHLRVPNCKQHSVSIPLGKPPWRVETTIAPLFKLSDYGLSDGREVTAVVSYAVKPA
jgi:hypothetical protein